MPDHQLTLTILSATTFAVCRLHPHDPLPEWASTAEFFSITRTTDELSLLCPQAVVPEATHCERDWRGLQVAGTLDFALTGILASLLAPLAEARISIFAVSTFDTDYLFVKENDFSRALEVLRAAGHRIHPGNS